VKPPKFRLGQLDAVEIHIHAHNTGTGVVDPGRSTLELTLDGERQMALSMAFGNGGTGREWRELPPGETAHDSRIGVEFVEAAGDHVLTLSQHGHRLAHVDVKVSR
jgi:hypothetical protein